MGWIKPEDKMPPSGLLVLLEVSGYWTTGLMSDHDFEIGCWLGNPDGNREPFWLIHGAVTPYYSENGNLCRYEDGKFMEVK